MTEKQLNEQYQYILSLLHEKRLYEALEILESLFDNSNIKERLNHIKTPYKYMLQYMLDGTEDPQREQLYTKLLRDTLNLTDDVFLQELDKNSYQIYHTYRMGKLSTLNTISYKELLVTLEAFKDELAVNTLYNDAEKIESCLVRHEKTLSNLFHKTWLSSNWNTGEKEEALEFIESKVIIPADLAMMVSAVTLSLTIKFDEKKFDWLLEAYKHEDLTINQRALVGIVMIMTIQHQRISYYPEITAKISFFLDNTHIIECVRNIYLQLLQSQETEKIDKKMRDEIIPEMMKKASNIKGLKFGFEEGEELNELNPEWSESLKNSGIDDKIREISELQMQGADVYMSSFASLKGYPFFQSIENWFYPFEKRHSSVFNEFGEENKKGSIIDLILNSSLFCNSDKYSFCFTIQHLPKEQRAMGLGQLAEEQMGGLEAEQKAMKLKELALDPSHISNQYIHDLYRFYKLYRYHREFKDIFNMSLNLHQISLFKPVISDALFLERLGEFFLKNEHYERAIDIYNLIEKMNKQTAEIHQKQGFCYQKLKEYNTAINYYIKADTLKPDSLWTNRHLATCYRYIKEYDNALYYYQEVEKVKPKNMNNLFYIGMCFTALHKYEEALQYFFKMNFIKEGDKRSTRAIGWTSYLIGNLDQAKNYYEKIIADTPLAVDYLNAGHVEWTLKNIRSAVKYYKLAAAKYDSKREFLEFFEKDKPQLIKQGVKEEDFPLMLDLIESE